MGTLHALCSENCPQPWVGVHLPTCGVLRRPPGQIPKRADRESSPTGLHTSFVRVSRALTQLHFKIWPYASSSLDTTRYGSNQQRLHVDDCPDGQKWEEFLVVVRKRKNGMRWLCRVHVRRTRFHRECSIFVSFFSPPNILFFLTARAPNDVAQCTASSVGEKGGNAQEKRRVCGRAAKILGSRAATYVCCLKLRACQPGRCSGATCDAHLRSA